MGWTVLGESVVGTSHRAKNAPCQDAFRLRAFGAANEWLVIAVADGAGSASKSEIGSALICEGFVQRVETLEHDRLFTRDGMIGLFTEVRSTLLAEAERLSVPARELACTALLGVLGPDCSAFCQLGDGAIVHGQGQDYRVAFWPEPVEYANATDFITDESFCDAIRFDTVGNAITEVAAFTDGLQRVALDYSDRTAYAGFFGPLFATIRSTEDAEALVRPFREFLDSEQVNKHVDDDKTLVLAVQRP